MGKKGRRGIGVDQPERWVFNRLADAYRARPGYPEPLIDRLVELARGGPVVDLGAGTGLVAIPLASRGLSVVAVEPASAMLDVLREQWAAIRMEPQPSGHPEDSDPSTALRSAQGERGEVRLVHRPAEETGLSPGFSLVVLADAAHWVDPERAGHEIRRLLAPVGVLAIVEPRFSDTPFMRAVAEELARLNPRARRVHGRGESQLFALATAGQPVHEERFVSEEKLDPAGLESVIRSLSFAGPALAPGSFAALLARLAETAQLEGGARWSRELFLRWSSLEQR